MTNIINVIWRYNSVVVWFVLGWDTKVINNCSYFRDWELRHKYNQKEDVNSGFLHQHTSLEHVV